MRRTNLTKVMGLVLAATMVAATPATAFASLSDVLGTSSAGAVATTTGTDPTTGAAAQLAAAAAQPAAQSGDTAAEQPATATALPLSTVIDRDADGNDAMYTTLLDADGKVVDTNDPNRTVDTKYKAKSDGGQGATVDKGATLYVNFRMASITEHDGDKGIQEGAVYTMDLPADLIPSAESLDGQKLIDPDTPISFFTTGGVKATGGIYTKHEQSGEVSVDDKGNTRYELHVIFSSVENQVDVSGEYQFSTTVSDAVEAGSTVTLSYVPGGTLSFNVTPDAMPQPKVDYSASIKGYQVGNTTYAIESSVTQTAGEGTGASTADFRFGAQTVHTDGNQGVLINSYTIGYDHDNDIFNNYGDGGHNFWLRLTYADGSAKSIVATSSNIASFTDGKLVVRFTDTDKNVQVDVTFDPEDALDGSKIDNGRKAYIAQSYSIVVTDGNGAPAKGVSSVQVSVPTVLPGDYTGTGRQAYQINLDTKDADGWSGPYSNGYTSADLGTFKTPHLQDHLSDPGSSCEYKFRTIYSYASSNSDYYAGNYYWTEFDPSVVHTGDNSNYYVSLASFLSYHSFSSETDGYALKNGQASTFANGSGLSGQSKSTEWQYAGTVSVGLVKYGTPMEGSCFYNGSAYDAKLQYQLAKVFADADPSQELIVYRSAQAKSNGEYMYLIVDPNTASNAKQQATEGGWHNYREDLTSKAKAGMWRIHVFNAPHTSLNLQFPQYLGSVDVDDAGTDSSSISITDKLQVGNGAYDASAQTSTTSSYYNLDYQATYMDSEWVSDDVIFWKMTVNVTNWQDWNESYLYAAVDQSLSLIDAPDGATISGAQVTNGGGSYAYAQQADGSWVELGGDEYDTSFSAISYADMNPGPTIDSGNGYGYRMHLTSDIYKAARTGGPASNNTKSITVGFFTKVTGKPTSADSTYSAKAQIVCHTGDATLIAGSDGNSWPTGCGQTTGYGQWAYRAAATGYAYAPQLAKSSASTSASSVSNLETAWTLKVSGLDRTGTNASIKQFTNSPLLFYWDYGHTSCPPYYSGVSGGLTLGDTMKGSSITAADGTSIAGVDVGKYTHITQMFSENIHPIVIEKLGSGGCGPIPYSTPSTKYGDTSWEKYVDGEWVSTDFGRNICWDSDKPGMYRRVLTTSGINSESDPLAIYVYYAGNMSDSVYDAVGTEALSRAGVSLADGDLAVYKSNSVVIEYRGLHYVVSLNDMTYTTQTDVAGLYAAANDVTGKTSEVDSLTQLYNLNLSNSARYGTWCVTDENPATSNLSTAITASLAIYKETPGVARNEDTGGLSGEYKLRTLVGMQGADYVNFEDYIGGFSNVIESTSGDDEQVTSSYDDTTDEGKAAVTELAKHITVKDLTITATDASGKESDVYKDGAFTGDWTGSTLKLGEGSHAGALFCGEFKRADGTAVSAGTLFTATYKAELNMDGTAATDTEQAVESFRSGKYYDGHALKIGNNAAAERPYTATGAANGADVAALTAEPVQLGDDMLMQLMDDGTSLTGGEIDKDDKLLRVWCDGNAEGTYLAEDTLIKNPLKTDSGDGITSWIFYDWTGTEGKGAADRTVTDLIEQKMDISLLDERTDLTEKEKHDYLTQLDILLAKYTTVANLKVYLSDAKPNTATGAVDGTLLWQVDGTISADQKTSVDGHDLTLTYIPASWNQDWEEDVDSVIGPGFSVGATNLGYNKYLTTTYDMLFDRDGFMKEAVENGWLTIDGKLVGTTKDCVWKVDNGVDNGNGQKASATAGEVKVSSATLAKSVNSVASNAGTAAWTLSGNTGNVHGNNSLTVSDEFTAAADNEAVAAAAQAATSITDVEVTYDGTLVWQNGALTDAARAAGWTDANIAVTVEGNKLSVSVSNTDAASPVASNKDVRVTYNTKLDRDAFAAALVAAGLTFDDAAYALSNNALLTVGGVSTSAGSKADFEPAAPLEATKTSDGHPNGDMAAASFTATAKTGAASRNDFSMTDAVTIEGDQAEAAAAALKLTSFNVTVTPAEGDAATYTGADVLAGKVEGVSLTRADGSELALDATGVSDWKLTFDALPANTTVSVAYDATVDRDAYLAAGGKADAAITLANSLAVSAADGSNAGAEAEGKVSVPYQIKKSGALSTEKAANGNPIINWTFDVYLGSSFTDEQLMAMDSVAVRDALNVALKADTSKVKVYDLKAGADGLELGDELAASEYEVAVTDGNVLIVTIKNPAAHRNVRIVAPTEVAATLDSITNSAELVVDGEVLDHSEVEEEGAAAVSQWGKITSAETPAFTPSAEKYVDGSLAGADFAGKFTFTCVEVDADGNEVKGGYTSTVTNDESGLAVFDKITYQAKPREGVRYYRISEVADGSDYVFDTTVYQVQVVVQKAADGNYLVSSAVVTPATAATVRFSNTSKRDLTVTKKWVDNNEVEKNRPDHVVVRLCQNGEPVSDAAVVLSDANKWSYTWHGLPIAGGEYSVVEEAIEGYAATIGKVTLGDDGNWSIEVTNTHSSDEAGKKDNKDRDKKENGTSDQTDKKQSSETSTSASEKKAAVPATGDIAAPAASVAAVGAALAVAGYLAVRSRRHE